MTIETLKNLLQRHGLSPNKTYGQHFLMDETVLEDMIDEAKVTDKDLVVEVGPGIGNLTERLLARGCQLLSLEKDPQFLRVLRSLQKKHDNFDYEIIDVLKYNFTTMSSPGLPQGGSGDPDLGSRIKSGMTQGNYKVVANIPYYITGKIVQLFLNQTNKPKSLTLLMQKEVAKNIVAKPGQLNLPAIAVQLYGQARLVSIVPAFKFYPKPKVDSAVLHIDLYQKPKYKLADEKKFFRILRACFAGKRKQIHNTLTNNLGLEKSLVSKLLTQVGIEPEARPQQLSIEQWIALVNKIELPN